MRRFCLVGIAFGMLLGLGCIPKMSVDSLKSMQPSRPAELDRLTPLIGKWEGSGEIRMVVLDKPLATTGTSTNSWDCDGRCMIERDEYEMGELGRVQDVGIWMWDERAKTFRMWRYDSMGGAAAGTAKYHEKSRCWKLKSKTQTPWGAMVSRGTFTMVDDNTIEWTWDEWPAWDWFGFFKIAEMKGTNRRK